VVAADRRPSYEELAAENATLRGMVEALQIAECIKHGKESLFSRT
jgi:hypothetical protein